MFFSSFIEYIMDSLWHNELWDDEEDHHGRIVTAVILSDRNGMFDFIEEETNQNMATEPNTGFLYKDKTIQYSLKELNYIRQTGHFELLPVASYTFAINT